MAHFVTGVTQVHKPSHEKVAHGNKPLTQKRGESSKSPQAIDLYGLLKVGTPNALIRAHSDIVTNKNKKDESRVTPSRT